MTELPSKAITTIVSVVVAIMLLSMLFLYVTGQKDASISSEKQMAEQGASIEEGRFLQYDGENVDGSEVMAAIAMLKDENVEILVNNGRNIVAMTDANGKLNGNYTTAKKKGDATYVSPAQTFTGKVERDEVTGRILKLTFDVDGSTEAVTPDVAPHSYSSDDDALAGTIYISYYKNDGTGGLLERSAATKNESVYITATQPTRAGYKFVGWSESSSATTADYISGIAVTSGFGGNTSLYAVWAVKTYDVTFNLSESASEIDAEEASAFGYDTANKKYTSFTMPTTEDYTIPTTVPTRAGYTFKGWGQRANGTVTYNGGDTYAGKTSITLYAIWTRNVYTIVYKGNGSTSGSMSDTTVYEGNSVNLTTNKFTRDGYSFEGWSTSETSNTVKYADGTSVRLTDADVDSSKTLTLYAVWDNIEVYNINYDVNNGSWTESTSDTVAEGELYNIPSKKPTRANYVFKGWSDGSKTYSAGSSFTATSDKDLTAQWKADEHTYKVNYYLCGVDGIEDSSHAELKNTFSYQTTSLSVVPFMYDYIGFETPAKKSYDVNVDGSTVIDLYYQRSKYTLTIKSDNSVTINDKNTATEVVGPNGSATFEVVYGDKKYYTATVDGSLGYDWSKWKSDPVGIAGNEKSIEITMPNHDVTVTAYSKALEYLITYNLNGMTNHEKNYATFKTNVKNHVYQASQRGYVFLGWESGDADSSKADKHLPAEWNPKKADNYDLEFDIPVNTRKNLTFTAHKRRAKYTVKYDKNFGAATGTMSAQTFSYDQGINLNDNGGTDSLPTLTKNAFTNSGYAFYGWNTKADGTGRFFKDNETVVNNLLTEALSDGAIDGATVTLYAVWYKPGNEAEIVESKWKEPTSAISAGTTLDKNPALQSNVGWSTWAIIRVTVPQYNGKDIATLNNISSAFTLLEDYTENGFHVMYYGYNNSLAQYGKTAELFQSITIANTGYKGSASVDVNGFSIESKYYKSISDVWAANVYR